MKSPALLCLLPLCLLACAQTAPRPAFADLVRAAGPPQRALESASASAQFHVLAGELAAGRDQPAVAATEFLKALDYLDDAELAERATQLAQRAGDAELSLRAARRWLALHPQALEAREIILSTRLAQGGLDDVREQAQEIIRGHAGGEADGFRHVALLLARAPQAQSGAVLALMQQLAAQWPQQPGGQHALGMLALRYKDENTAEAAARAALKLAPDSREHALLLVGVLVRKPELAEADALIQRLAKLPGQTAASSAELRLSYARLLLEADHREAARAQMQQALKLDAQNHDARYALGVLALNDNNLSEAEQLLTPLLKTARAQDAALQLGRLAELRGQREQALDFYLQVTRGAPALDAALRRAAVLGRMGRVDVARGQLSSLREQLPQLAARFYLAEGELLLDAKRPAEAVTLYGEALQRHPQDPDLLYARSLAHERSGNIASAETDLRAILDAEADNARALNALGYMLTVHTRRFDEAQDLIQRALALEPDDAAILDSMGWLHFRRGDARRALDYLQRAHTKFADAEISAHLGEVLWTLGDKEAARALWAQALKKDPDHPVLGETVKRLSP